MSDDRCTCSKCAESRLRERDSDRATLVELIEAAEDVVTTLNLAIADCESGKPVTLDTSANKNAVVRLIEALAGARGGL